MEAGPKARLFVAGLSVGALLFAIAPVGAHHNDAALRDRVEVLENKVKKLTKKTSRLNATGTSYDGVVYGPHVWNHSDNGCTSPAEQAWWGESSAQADYFFLACPGTSSPSADPVAPPVP